MPRKINTADTSVLATNVSLATTLARDGLTVAPEGQGIIGSIYSYSGQQNSYNATSWSSSGPWTTYYAYNPGAGNSLIQFVNMALGDGFSDSGSSQNTYSGDMYGGSQRDLLFSNGNRVGRRGFYLQYDNSTSYPGTSFQILPIRNTSSSSINVTVYGYCSTYWSAGFEGYSLFYLTPNTNQYSTVTSVTSSVQVSGSGTNSTGTTFSATVTVPANTTVLVCMSSSACYQTTYRFTECNMFYNLNTTFSNPAIICDMRMLSALKNVRFNLPYSGSASGTSLLAPLWTKTAAIYGDR